MKKILSKIGAILIALCVEVGLVMLIVHWWGATVAMVVLAIECVAGIWTGYELLNTYDQEEELGIKK